MVNVIERLCLRACHQILEQMEGLSVVGLQSTLPAVVNMLTLSAILIAIKKAHSACFRDREHD